MIFFCAQNIDEGYMLERIKYPQSMFKSKNKKNMYTSVIDRRINVESKPYEYTRDSCQTPEKNCTHTTNNRNTDTPAAAQDSENYSVSSVSVASNLSEIGQQKLKANKFNPSLSKTEPTELSPRLQKKYLHYVSPIPARLRLNHMGPLPKTGYRQIGTRTKTSSSFHNWRLQNARRRLCHANAGNTRTVITGTTTQHQQTSVYVQSGRGASAGYTTG